MCNLYSQTKSQDAMRHVFDDVAEDDEVRNECLNEEIFDGLADPRRDWALCCDDCSNVRPHSSLGNQTPAKSAPGA